MSLDLYLAALAFGAVAFFGWRAYRQRRGHSGLVIGPWYKGKTRSPGYPMHLDRNCAGWSISLSPGKELTAVLDYDASIPLTATKLVWHYRAEIERAYPTERPTTAPLVSLVIQRTGDDWTAQGDKANYRFYSPAFPLESGEHTRVIPLQGWTNVWGQPADMRLAIANLSNLAVAFGHSSGRMHGVSGVGSFTQLSLEAIS